MRPKKKFAYKLNVKAKETRVHISYKNNIKNKAGR